MRFLFVAPEICAPWTEGRKNFVRWLAAELNDDDEVLLFTTVPRGHEGPTDVPAHTIERRGKATMLWSLLRELPGQIHQFKPDLVCHFPYGTFRAHYGPVNRGLLRAVEAVCRRHDLPCLTVMYSIDQFQSPRALAGLVSNLALGRRPGWDGHLLDPGISMPRSSLTTTPERRERQILFMAGMWESTRARVDHVLDVRGLGVLLRAGTQLAAAGVELRVASPLLATEGCKDYLLGHASNCWPRSQLSLEASVTKPEAYQEATLFAFPYQHDIEVFTPTSVIESMFLDTPVVMSDIALLRGLAAKGERAYLFKHDDPDDLARVVLQALDAPADRQARAGRALDYVQRNWSIAHSAHQLRGIADGILSHGVASPD